MSTNLPISRKHQTALVIDARVTNDAFKGRYRRLLESVNNENIKVDVLTLRGTTVTTEELGGPLVVGGPDQVKKESPAKISPLDLNAWAASVGYTMLIVASCVGDNEDVVENDGDDEDDEYDDDDDE